MPTLLMRLEGPMQSWGTSSRFTERDTGLEPSKSGVIGLICATLGKPRHEKPGGNDGMPSLATLAALRMGVRVDHPGTVAVDFQTAGGGWFAGRDYGVAKADGGKGESVTSWRYYLQDAAFIVGLESQDLALLRRLHAALREPKWPLYLGRKSYVPSEPVFLADGLQAADLETCLQEYPVCRSDGSHDAPLKTVVDHPTPHGAEVRVDVPLDFARRRFGVRYVRVSSVQVKRRPHGDPMLS